MINFLCYLPAERPFFVSTTLDEDDWVITLSEAIVMDLRANGGGLKDITPLDFQIFKTDLSLDPENTFQSRALHWILEQPAGRELHAARKLSSVFPEGSHPVNNRQLDIMIVNAEVLEMVDGLHQQTLEIPVEAMADLDIGNWIMIN